MLFYLNTAAFNRVAVLNTCTDSHYFMAPTLSYTPVFVWVYVMMGVGMMMTSPWVLINWHNLHVGRLAEE